MRVEQRTVTPADAALYGLAAGLTATVLLSALARLPGLRERAEDASLLDRSWTADEEEFGASPVPMSPAAVLAQSSGPGPEGPAGLFAAKVASGLFGRDLKRTRPWGRIVHLAYGSFWGVLYGILQTKHSRRPELAGASHGVFVWAFGPALLVPAMKLMPPPSKAPREQTAISLAAHVIYGVTLARLFNLLIRSGSAHEPSGS
jgi:hypothetical protein